MTEGKAGKPLDVRGIYRIITGSQKCKKLQTEWASENKSTIWQSQVNRVAVH